ncbi:hypothetical protein AB205_0218670 [Aquarana catesbeiana]|uniref:Uncharacterized protein n=1 Tax=Aquarana catesbeiana TaxID=8400 RepID=A0A2G9R3R7_AQUCT|nr:hypothetical protein AB205_0218670 [Aquarana catesbeiana]
MVEMVDILVRTDYDWKHGPYRNPNARKAKIMAKVVRSDVNVVEDQTHFSSASAQILISELLVCNRELEKMNENMHDLQNRVINIINILAKI